MPVSSVLKPTSGGSSFLSQQVFAFSKCTLTCAVYNPIAPALQCSVHVRELATCRQLPRDHFPLIFYSVKCHLVHSFRPNQEPTAGASLVLVFTSYIYISAMFLELQFHFCIKDWIQTPYWSLKVLLRQRKENGLKKKWAKQV
jgi:hypothetical protein